MSKRIRERMAIETVESVTDELNEINNMLRNMIASLHAINEDLAAARRARRNGEDNV